MIVKTLDNFKIVTRNDDAYDMADDLSTLVRSLNISPPPPNFYREKMPGRNGSVRVGMDYDERVLTAVCTLFGEDYLDFLLRRNRLINVLTSGEPFYIVTDAEPGKRWDVEVANDWTPNKIGASGDFTIQFVSASSYCEAVGKTTDPLTFDSGLWQFGQGLISEDVSYVHTTNRFDIYNAGLEIDPREVYLKIIYTGASSNLKLKNHTTGEEWTYTGTSNTSDVIEIDRIRPVKNGLTIVRNTNKMPISLAPGWNDIEVIGTSGSFEITFDFRFIYFA
ncbi:phage tail family protein [Sutcliffiella horikoshii]|uniref:Phage tail family protein n=1 Tax=Sutcliffiella horikoshii TaxID=79883 RepID=A0A5D4SBY1_9BACI|nr:phage tail family protein [Sutcliffiella horikoshii]TYS60469.1 phage tail family protein [Sutcliffiella horikoshii]